MSRAPTSRAPTSRASIPPVASSLLAPLIAIAGCSGGAAEQQVKIAPPPAPVTRATLAGPRCASGQACTCRDEEAPGDGGVGAPGPGAKRFEIRVGPASNPLWVTLDHMVLYKSEQHATDCFYVDLAPGEHHMTLRAHQAGGLSAAVTVHEWGPAAKSWYDTFHFECGAPGACSNEELNEQKGELARAPHGVHDACGSVKVKGLAWASGTAPDFIHPEDLAAEWTLDVYKFATTRPHGDQTCVRHHDE